MTKNVVRVDEDFKKWLIKLRGQIMVKGEDIYFKDITKNLVFCPSIQQLEKEILENVERKNIKKNRRKVRTDSKYL